MGPISGGLEILDFDLKAELYQPWCELVEDAAPGLIAKFPVGKTQNNGRHLIFRCPDIKTPGNAKLAQRKVGDEIKTLIETRGKGGQFLATPTAGYDFLQGDFTTVPVITPEERQILIDAALALNEYCLPEANRRCRTPAAQRNGKARRCFQRKRGCGGASGKARMDTGAGKRHVPALAKAWQDSGAIGQLG